MLFHPRCFNTRARRDRGSRIAPMSFVIARVGSIAIALATVAGSGSLGAESYFPQRPDDPRAVDFTNEAFGAHADGVGDDAEALQQAVNRVQETTRLGVVLIP